MFLTFLIQRLSFNENDIMSDKIVIQKLIFVSMKSSSIILDFFRERKFLNLIKFKSMNETWWSRVFLLTILILESKTLKFHSSSSFFLIHETLNEKTFCHRFNNFLLFAYFRCNNKSFFFQVSCFIFLK